MKKIITLLAIFISLLTKAQIPVEIVFHDLCKDSIIQLDYGLLFLDTEDFFIAKNSITEVPEFGKYSLSTSIEKENWNECLFEIIEISDSSGFKDTLTFSQIRFTVNNNQANSDWNYYKCDKLCNGEETDYYNNGSIRLKGQFVNGKPSEIIEYRKDGTKKTRKIYKLGFQEYKRVEYFDKIGNLDTYEVYKIKKRKTIIKYFDSGNQLIETKVNKHHIQRTGFLHSVYRKIFQIY